MRIYLTSQGDMLDAICKAELGDEAQVPLVLEANPHLADLGPVYAAGVAITLPDLPTPLTSGQVRLWGSG